MGQTLKEESNISFVVMHNDNVLGESIPLIIDPCFKEPSQIYDVNFEVEFSFIVNDRNSMDPIVSTPILSKNSRRDISNKYFVILSIRMIIKSYACYFVSKDNLRCPRTTRFRWINRGIEEESNSDRFAADIDFIERDWFLHSRFNADITR